MKAKQLSSKSTADPQIDKAIVDNIHTTHLRDEPKLPSSVSKKGLSLKFQNKK